MLPPSKTSSSWPPTRLQYATGRPVRRACAATRSRRSSHFPAWYGDAEMLRIRFAPSFASRATGPRRTQMSSQIVIPTRASPTGKIPGSVPRRK